ncbi:MAG TPA: tetratricopeptide repeat protein [Chthoniobacterales bacterium]|nr:tetratricopeptide repeat protein [Chthoniobacterales bacterium]
MTGFFQELKRRKVFRVAIAYIVASWALAQGLAQVLPVFDISNSSIRVLIALMLIGFPVALVLAWIFDVTPQGIRATPAAAPPRQLRRNIIMLAAFGVIVSLVAGFFLLLPHAVAHKVDKSIAVLPFENLSDDKENAYFADGIQDDILTNLSNIGDLRVISRTSVMNYRDKTPNVREIGKTLGVSNILEGSVRRSGNQVRVNVQLIDTTSDKHVWAKDYDGDLTDVFKIQTYLAQEIATALQAKLSPNEKERIEKKPTENNAAYTSYVLGHELQDAFEDFDKLKQAEEKYEQAIQLDPKFALAFARYSQLESWIVHTFDKAPGRRQKARNLAESAISLQPDLPEAHLALGFVDYYVDNNFDNAAREFETARRGLPNESEVYLALGAIQRRQGKWAESNANFEKAINLNPKNTWAMLNLALSYQMQRNFTAANKWLDSGLALDPNAIGLLATKAKLAIFQNGDFDAADKALATIDMIPQAAEVKSELATGRVSLLLLEHKFDQARDEAAKIPDSILAKMSGGLCQKSIVLGIAKKAAHDDAGARDAFQKAKAAAEDDITQNPDDAGAHSRLAESLAWLGEKDTALVEIQRAKTLLPESKDALDGPDIAETEAGIHAMFGDAAGAVSILDGLLQRPSNVTVALLKVDPTWDPIRNDSGFKALIDKYSGKT